MEMKNCTIHAKVWIEDADGKVVFGEGRYRILEAVGRLRSLQAAAAELKMSYRALWGRLKASEDRLGRPLVARAGRGSELTPYAQELVSRYRELQEQIHHESDRVFAQLQGSEPEDGEIAEPATNQ